MILAICKEFLFDIFCIPMPVVLSEAARRRPATAGVEGAALTISGRNAAVVAAAAAGVASCARLGDEAKAGVPEDDDTMSTPVDESWRRRCALPRAARESANDDEAGAAELGALEKFALNSMSMTAGGRLAPAAAPAERKGGVAPRVQYSHGGESNDEEKMQTKACVQIAPFRFIRRKSTANARC